MLTAALFTTAKTGKQPKCPSADEWIKKIWCVYTMEYHSALKKKNLQQHKRLGGHYANGNKSDRERQVLSQITHAAAAAAKSLQSCPTL